MSTLQTIYLAGLIGHALLLLGAGVWYAREKLPICNHEQPCAECVWWRQVQWAQCVAACIGWPMLMLWALVKGYRFFVVGK